MIEAYSSNITVPENQPVPFNSVSLAKGCEVVQRVLNTFVFNECGVYEVEVDASGSTTGTTAVNLQLQLYKNGVPQPQADTVAQSTAAADVVAMGFKTFVQVPQDNTSCCCSTPTTIQLMNGPAAINLLTANIAIKKVKYC